MIKKLTWDQASAIQREVAAGPWTEWVKSARRPKDIVTNSVRDRLASTLGLPSIPAGKGVLSLGWIISKMCSSMSHATDASAAGTALRRYGRSMHGVNRLPWISELVFDLMCHRELITKHSHNAFEVNDRNSDISLFANHWSSLSQAVLDWAMTQSPLQSVDQTSLDEWVYELHVQNNRLHCTTGPAFVSTKGRSLYALNGVILTKEEFDIRGFALRILSIPNVEARRVLIEDMGAERFIAEAKLYPIHSDETGKLYRLDDDQSEGWRRRHLAWVHVVCPSTDREYMLAVPPNTRTAREGVAWTFRKLPEEYNPGVQT